MSPVISEQPSFKRRSVLIAWEKPPKTGKELDEMDDIKSYRCVHCSVISYIYYVNTIKFMNNIHISYKCYQLTLAAAVVSLENSFVQCSYSRIIYRL